MTRPMVSVIIPAYNRAGFLAAALESINAQGLAELEVLLIDDGSTDELESLVQRSYSDSVRYFRQEHRGVSAARNRGILESRAEFIAFLDIDDAWPTGQLPVQLEALCSYPEAGIAQGLMRHVIESSEGAPFQSAPYRMPYLGSCLFRRWVFEQCGLFDESMECGEDYDFFFRCWERDVPKVHVENVSLLYRRHSGNLTAGKNGYAHLLVLKRRIERIKAGLVDPDSPRQSLFQTYIGDLTALTTGA